MKAFNVYFRGKRIDTIYYRNDSKVTKEEVRDSLIKHDGFNRDIKVTLARK